MPISRVYQDVPLAVESPVKLNEEASHHLARVLRAAVGDEVVIFNGAGGEYQAVITRIDKKSVEVMIKSFADVQRESPIQIHLAQGIARGEKMDFIVQKAVELGVAEITPLITERCNVRLDQERSEKRLQHWRSVAISACEQSGRTQPPVIHAPRSLQDWLKNTRKEIGFVLSPHVTEKLFNQASNPFKQIAILIGPEGGLSDQEVALANAAQFLPLNLGPRVLRTETASLAALTILQSQFGDMV